MATQVLIIYGQLSFAIRLKQAVERTAGFEAHPFTSVEAALDYLRERVQDVALVDFAIPDFPGEKIVEQLRAVQPSLAMIATPQLSPERVASLGLIASLGGGFGARDLVSIIDSYFARNDRPSYGDEQPPRKRPASEPPVVLPESAPPEPPPQAQTVQFFEPDFNPGDMPQGVPEELAWPDEPSRSESAFDDVLSSIDPDTPDSSPRNPFTDLVNSMRSDEAHRPLLTRQQQLVEYILTPGVESLFDEPEPPPQSSKPTMLERLAQEEPPPPTFEESGTVSDLVTGVHERSFQNVLSILSGEDALLEGEEPPPTPEPPPAPPKPESKPLPRIKPLRVPGPEEIDTENQPTPAKMILQRTLEQSLSGGGFSLEELLANIEEQLPLHRPKVKPLPSWVREEEQKQGETFLVDEPDFLPEEMPPEPTPSEDLYPNQTTQPARGQVIEQHPEALETEWLESGQKHGETLFFPETLPEEIPADPTVVHRRTPLEDVPPEFGLTVLHEALPAEDTSSGWIYLPEQDFNTQFEMMAAFEVYGQSGASSGALYTEVPVEPPSEDGSTLIGVEESPAPAPASASAPEVEDPYVAQLALSLTEASLELTAEAILLAREKTMVAYAGQMPEEEIDELRETIADDWDAAPGEVRIRFITAQGSGKDYMLYSRRTEDDFTLSLIFAGTTPLRDIRRQGQRLVDALAEVPEAPASVPETPAPRVEPVEAMQRTPYACVWLLNDPRAHLDAMVSQAISAGLNIQMSEKQWVMQTLQVHEDYVYVLAEVPGEEPAYQIVRELKRRAAEIAHAQNRAYPSDGLWADSYLVVTPGRELDIEEIQQFINFERMG